MSNIERETACKSIGTLGRAGTSVSIVWRLCRIEGYRAERVLSAGYHNAITLQLVTTPARL